MTNKILIIGHAGCGKDQVADFLKSYGISCCSSSLYSTEPVMMPYFESQGMAYTTAEICFADRVNHRDTWFREIENYNYPTWCRISTEMLEAGYDGYIGMRSRKEFEASKHLYDQVIWIDSSKRVPDEPATSMELVQKDATLVLDNNGTLEELERNAKLLSMILHHQYCVRNGLDSGLSTYRALCAPCGGSGVNCGELNTSTMMDSECQECHGYGGLTEHELTAFKFLK